MMNELVARIVERTLADERKTLARSASHYDIDVSLSDACQPTKLFAGRFHDARANGGAIGEVELMHRAMNRVDIDRGYDIEAGLFEAETQSSRAGEEVDSDWACHENILA